MESLEQQIQRLVGEKIEIVAYDPGWPAMFASEKADLLAWLPNDLLGRIEHFGSTAVPKLDAKPIIDMLIEVSSLEETRKRIVPILVGRGYEYVWRPTFGDDGPPWYAWLIKRDADSGARTHHLHMVEANFTEHWNRLYFRDFLIANPDLAKEYATLKRGLATAHANDRVAYTQRKSEFIVRVTQQALEAYGNSR